MRICVMKILQKMNISAVTTNKYSETSKLLLLHINNKIAILFVNQACLEHALPENNQSKLYSFDEIISSGSCRKEQRGTGGSINCFFRSFLHVHGF